MGLEGKKRAPTAGWVMTLYYGQGLPFSIVRQVSVVFFRDLGVSLSSLGLVSLFGIPWTFKFLWGPFVDSRLTKRKWILLMELCLGAALGFVALGVSQHLSAPNIAALLFFIAILAATHDIAIDGFYLEALDRKDQAKFSGLWQMGYRLALLTGSGLIVALSAVYSWWILYGALGVFFIALAGWHSFVLPASIPTAPAEKAKSIPLVDAFQKFLQLPKIGPAIAFIILFKIGDALLFAMSSPFLLDSGLSKKQLGLISGAFGTGSAIGATLFGGWFISRYSLRKGLYVFGVLQNVAIPVYAIVAWVRPGVWGFAAAVIIEQISAGLGSAAYANFAMRQIDPNYRATHYAIATGFMAMTTMLVGAVSGFGAHHFGYPIFFILAFITSLPGLFMIPFIARRPECE